MVHSVGRPQTSRAVQIAARAVALPMGLLGTWGDTMPIRRCR